MGKKRKPVCNTFFIEWIKFACLHVTVAINTARRQLSVLSHSSLHRPPGGGGLGAYP